MNRLIFLDIDGVLNCKASHTFYDLEHPESYGIDQTLWNNFWSIVSTSSDILVVIHSGWIKHKDEPDYEWDMGFPEKGIKIKTQLPKVINLLGDRYVGCVDYIKGQPKSRRIEKWLEDRDLLNNPKYEIFILDDDQSNYTNLNSLEVYKNIHVFFTDNQYGFDHTTALNFEDKLESV